MVQLDGLEFMTKLNKLALMAGIVGVLGVTSAHATGYNNDLIIGFSDGVGNDLLYDLGAPSAITNGASWNLSALVSTFTLNTVNWGVVGNSSQTLQNRLIYTTFGSAPGPVNSGIGSQLNTDLTSMYQPFPAAGAGQHLSTDPTGPNSWNQQTINPTLSAQYANEFENPNVTGLTSIKLWKVQANSTPGVLLGSFSLAANGVVTFATNSVVSGPPAPQITSITRAGNVSTISFTTTNGSFTYKLYYTNATGLKVATSLWATSATTVTGDGLVKSIPDTTTDTNRFYRVSAQ
jgi:hypothetical protein